MRRLLAVQCFSLPAVPGCWVYPWRTYLIWRAINPHFDFWEMLWFPPPPAHQCTPLASSSCFPNTVPPSLGLLHLPTWAPAKGYWQFKATPAFSSASTVYSYTGPGVETTASVTVRSMERRGCNPVLPVLSTKTHTRIVEESSTSAGLTLN